MNERRKPWEFGKDVQATTVADMLTEADMNWTVESKPVYAFTDGFQEIPNMKVNVRSDNGLILGNTTEKYKIVQNTDAYAFLDTVIESGYGTFDKAGTLNGGELTWASLALEPMTLLDDSYENYLIVLNNHNGKGAIKVFVSPIRVACSNMLNVAYTGADRQWSIKHMGNVEGKLQEAQQTMMMSEKYITQFQEFVMKTGTKKISNGEFQYIVEMLFPIDKDLSDRMKNNIIYNRDGLIKCYDSDDLGNLKGTGLGVINAVSDFLTHTPPVRNTESYEQNMFIKMAYGHKILDEATEMVLAA